MVPGRRYTPRYIVAVLRRRWLLLAVPLLVTASLAALLARALPDVYYAEGLVKIVPQQIPESYVRTTVTVPIAERLRATAQEVKSAATLGPLIDEFGLYANLRSTVSKDALVAWMARSTRIELTRPDTILVGYSGYDRTVVAKVAERLVHLVIESSTRDRSELADTAGKFLDAELESTRARLVDQEQRIQAFRERYAGQLPTQVPANLQIMQGWQTQLQGLMDELRQDRDRRARLVEVASSDTAATEATKPDPAKADGDTAPLATPADDSKKSDAALVSTDPYVQQLAGARAAMDELLKRYRPEHPDVVRLQWTIAELEKTIAADPADRPRRPGNGDAPPPPTRAQIARAEIKALDARIQEREALERRLRDGVAQYQARIEAVPSRESEWMALTRDYQTLQQTYAAVLAKKEESRISANLEKRRIGEQFRTAAVPVPPTRPVSPDRPGIILIGLLVGTLAGLTVPAFLEITDTRLRAEKEVVTALRLPVLAMLPRVIVPVAGQRRRTWRVRVGLAALVVLAVAAAWRVL